MITDNFKALILLALLTLLIAFVGVDYADEPITATAEPMNTTNCTVVDGVHYDNRIINGTGVAKVHKIVTEKPKYPLITMTGKPSCTRCARNGCAYTWRTKTYINYCPHCHHWNCLGNKHKWGSVHEKEISCFRCDSDFCVNCGKTKYSWSRVYLRRP